MNPLCEYLESVHEECSKLSREELIIKCIGLEHALQVQIQANMGGSALALILNERKRQLIKGYDAHHDDTEKEGQLSRAAACCAKYAAEILRDHSMVNNFQCPEWPWSDTAWKPPGSPIDSLVKSGALIIAEIERLQRLESSQLGESEFGCETAPMQFDVSKRRPAAQPAMDGRLEMKENFVLLHSKGEGGDPWGRVAEGTREWCMEQFGKCTPVAGDSWMLCKIEKAWDVGFVEGEI